MFLNLGNFGKCLSYIGSLKPDWRFACSKFIKEAEKEGALGEKEGALGEGGRDVIYLSLSYLQGICSKAPK
jgi:hypothetical protein